MKFITQDIIAIRTFGEDVHISHIRKYKAEPVDFKAGTVSNLWGTGQGSTLEDEQYLKDFYSPDFSYNFNAERSTAILLELPKGDELESLSMSEVQGQIFYTGTGGLIYGFFIPAGVSYWIQGRKVNRTYIKSKINSTPLDLPLRQHMLNRSKLKTEGKPQYKPNDLLTIEELADYLSLKVGTVYNKVSNGEIIGPSKPEIKRWLFSDIERWVRS